MSNIFYDSLNEHFFSYTNKIVFKPRLEGQLVTDIIMIGDRAGPQIDVSNLCHEMCHFVEIDDARMKMSGWGLKYPQVYVYDRYCIEPKTMQGVEREIIVLAFQANLMEFIGCTERIDEFAESLKWLPDFCYVPSENALSYKEKINSRISWIKTRIAQQRNQYTIENFKKEWFRKINLLRG